MYSRSGPSTLAVGRVEPLVVPAAELAVISHHGPLTDVDITYGKLGDYTTRHETGWFRRAG
jgi:effector-binding domain-containing protein